ncbi:MAG: hypothetical protein LBC86_09420 [Oscillospiraceae bacterium]|nr:hypothetical protein [Oscillospiraceae bacterium]
MKKFVLCLTAALAAFTLAAGASALHLIEDGNVAELIVDNSGDVDGVLILEMSEGLSLTRDPQSPGGALVVYNAENGRMVVAGLGLEAGDAVIRLTFDGAGTFTIAGESGSFDGIGLITGEIGEVAPPDITPEPEPEPQPEPEPEPQPIEENPKGGVVLAIVPALAAAAVVAISRKKELL